MPMQPSPILETMRSLFPSAIRTIAIPPLAEDECPSDEDPASFPQGRGEFDRWVPRREPHPRVGRFLSVEVPTASEVFFPRFALGCTAYSDQRNDLPCLLNHAHRCAVDDDLARGNGHALRVNCS